MSDQKNQPEKRDYGQVFFAWDFMEFQNTKRDSSWYVWAGIVVGLLLLFCLFTKNFLFAVIVILTALTILLFERHNRQIKFQITEDGVLLNDQFYDYNELKNFYLIYQPPMVKTLYFEPKSVFKPRIPVFLEDQNPVKIREVLLKYLPEDLTRENEPTSDQFSRLLKL